jgi:hypothetical protein
MRETCARVLAAALMTGAIATVVGFAAHVGTPTQAGSPIAVLPSLHQRSVRLTAQPAPAPRKRTSTARLVTTHTTRRPARPQVTTRGLVVVRRHRAKRAPASRELAATATATPAPQAAPVQPAPPAPQTGPAPAPTSTDEGDQGEADGPGHGHGRGHAYGQGKQDD